MSKAIRNRQIKRTLESAFGKGNVRVRGARGTAYGYVDVDVNWTPLDADQSGVMRAHCKALLRAAGVDLGRTYSDDTCEREVDMCHIGFNQARYWRTMRHPDGTMSAMRDYDSAWESVADRRKPESDCDALNDFNYVGSRHHY